MYSKVYKPFNKSGQKLLPGRVAQPVTCLATDASLTADLGSRVRSRPGPILSWRLIIKLFLRSLSSLPLNHSRRVVVSYKRKYVHEVLVNCLFKLAQEKSVVRWTDRPAMTIAVDLGRKETKKKKKVWSKKPISWAWFSRACISSREFCRGSYKCILQVRDLGFCMTLQISQYIQIDKIFWCK